MNTRIWRTIGALTVPVFALAACGSDTDSPSDPAPGGDIEVPGDAPADDAPVDDAPVDDAPADDPVETEAPLETEAPADE